MRIKPFLSGANGEAVRSCKVLGKRMMDRRRRGAQVFWQGTAVAVQAVGTVVAFGVALSRSPDRTSWRSLAGVVLFVPSFALWLWARATLASRACFAVAAQAPPELITTGPYQYFKHPVYCASTLYAAGLLLIVGNTSALAALLLVLVPVQVYRSNAEDRLLHKRFGVYWEAWALRSEDLFC